jgi:hypothetical protein
VPDLPHLLALLCVLAVLCLEVALQLAGRVRARQAAAGEEEAERILCYAVATGRMVPAPTPPPRPRELHAVGELEREPVHRTGPPRLLPATCLCVLAVLTAVLVALRPVHLSVPSGSPPVTESSPRLRHEPPRPAIPQPSRQHRTEAGPRPSSRPPQHVRQAPAAEHVAEPVAEGPVAEDPPAPRHRRADSQPAPQEEGLAEVPQVETGKTSPAGISVDVHLEVGL